MNIDQTTENKMNKTIDSTPRLDFVLYNIKRMELTETSMKGTQREVEKLNEILRASKSEHRWVETGLV